MPDEQQTDANPNIHLSQLLLVMVSFPVVS